MTYKATVYRDGLYLMAVKDYERPMIAIGDGHQRLAFFQIPRYHGNNCTVRVHYRYDEEWGRFYMHFSWYEGQIRHWTESWYSHNRFILTSVPYKQWHPSEYRHKIFTMKHYSRHRAVPFLLQ